MGFIILLDVSPSDTKRQRWRKYKKALNWYKTQNNAGNTGFKQRKYHTNKLEQ
jgi:hypothetical protein